MTNRRYTFLGVGGVGGYYGGLLAKAGLPVNFLARGDYAAIREHGLTVDSPRGGFHLPKVSVFASPADLPPADIVVVAIKSTENRALVSLLPTALAPNGVVLTLQNGLGPDDDAAAIVGADRVLAGLCFLCSNRIGPGHIQHLDYGAVTLGEYRADGSPGGETERLIAIANDFSKAGIEIRVAKDLRAARWSKLAWNVPFNGLSVVLDTTTDRIMADASSRSLAAQLMDEVAAAAAWEGKPIPREFLDRLLADTAVMKPYQTSMKLDFDQGRPMEVEAIFGNPFRAAQAAGVATPRLEAMYRLLSFLDHRRGAKLVVPSA